MVKKRTKRRTIFSQKKAPYVWPPKQFLLHFYALMFFQIANFYNFCKKFSIFYCFLLNFTLKRPFLLFLKGAQNFFKAPHDSQSRTNVRQGAHYWHLWLRHRQQLRTRSSHSLSVDQSELTLWPGEFKTANQIRAGAGRADW